MLHKFVFVLHLKTFKALLFMSLLCFGLCCYLISNHIIYLQNSPYLSISCRFSMPKNPTTKSPWQYRIWLWRCMVCSPTIFSTITRTQKKSISFPRPSYDGHFLCYTLSDYGQFSIWHHEAETSIQKEMSARPLCCPSEIRAVSTLSAFFPSMCQIS